MIPLGTWTPDAPAYGTHSTIARNCVPYADHYAPFYAAVAYTDASSEASKGAFAAKASDGTPYNFIGGTSKLQLISSAAWTDVSKALGYTTGSEDRWYWTTFGNIVIASNGQAKLQAYTMGTSTDFDDLDTTAPVAKYVATVRGFVFAGNISGAANRVQWGPIEDPAGDWSTGAQADLQDLYGETQVGQVTQVVGGEYATVFCENGIFRLTYVGGEFIFTNDQIVRGNGTTAPGSVASYGEKIFFLGSDGFYVMDGGGVPVPIGQGIDRTFLNEVYESEYWRISSAIDPRNSLYIVAYPTAGTVLDKFLIYNWRANRWTEVTGAGNLETLFTFYSEGYTLETIDALIGNPDTGPYADVSIDSALFAGGKPSLAAIDSSHQAVLFNGAALTAIVETGEAQLNPGQKTLVTKLIPMVEGSGTIQAQVGYRNTVQSAVSYTDAATVNSEGEACLFNTGRFQRARLTLSSGFEKAYGVDWDGKPAGRY